MVAIRPACSILVMPLIAGACGPRTTADVLGIQSLEAMQVTSLHSTRCVIAGSTSGQSSVLPSLKARCAAGPGRRCQVTQDPEQPWHYVFPPDDPAWQEWGHLGYVPPSGTHFHKQFRWNLEKGECMFTVAMYGDLDDDGVYSTFERIEKQTADGERWTYFNEQNEE